MKCVEFPKRLYQKCPLCGEEQVTMMRGLVRDMEDPSINIAHDKGYSFCNCRNIFYTDYKNIDKSLYDESYVKRYEESEDAKMIAVNELGKLYPLFKKFSPDAKKFFEIGSVHDHVLDFMKDKGFDCKSLNINERKSNFNLIVADFETVREPVLPYGVDIIFASHIFEHFKSPARELKKCRDMMSDNGLLYIAMPDTFFADFEGGKAQQFDWMVQEHHILWNMDNWVEYVEEHGFKCVHKERCLDMHKQTNGKWLWKQDYKTIFKKDIK